MVPSDNTQGQGQHGQVSDEMGEQSDGDGG